MQNKDNIILIGMPGCGKSTIGVLLAKALAREFYDSDLLIQRETGKLLKDIIRDEGLSGFNAIEDRVNAKIDCHNSIIATGGSVIFGENAMAHFKEIGTVVYLYVSCDDIGKRLGDLDERGVVHKSGETISDIFKVRDPLYRKYADITVREPEGDFNMALVLAETVRTLRDKGF